MSRWEEIEGTVSTWKTILSEGDFADVTSEEVELVESVIQQAQKAEELQAKVDELEKELTTVKIAYDDRVLDIEILDKENQYYKQALKFYSDEGIYEEDDENYRFYVPEIIHDNGETARQALKGVEG